jgi:hypothetical protein
VATRARSVGDRDWEAKDSHLHDLEGRLTSNDLAAAGLAGDAVADKSLLDKARRRILSQPLAGRDLTPAMLDTPRERLRTRAFRGHWGGFPVSPASYADLFGAAIEEAVSPWSSNGWLR